MKDNLQRWAEYERARREDDDMPTAGAIVWSLGAILVALCGVGLWLILR